VAAAAQRGLNRHTGCDSWFEEPVSLDDLDGLRPVRERGPAAMNIAAGEYGYDPFCFRRLLKAGAVDVLQGRRITMRRG
jgi:L-alanine-DL-glutamate epimerase-like enolase superfamily enzyme